MNAARRNGVSSVRHISKPRVPSEPRRLLLLSSVPTTASGRTNSTARPGSARSSTGPARRRAAWRAWRRGVHAGGRESPPRSGLRLPTDAGCAATGPAAPATGAGCRGRRVLGRSGTARQGTAGRPASAGHRVSAAARCPAVRCRHRAESPGRLSRRARARAPGRCGRRPAPQGNSRRRRPRGCGGPRSSRRCANPACRGGRQLAEASLGDTVRHLRADRSARDEDLGHGVDDGRGRGFYLDSDVRLGAFRG